MTNRTREFREVIKHKEAQLPPNKRPQRVKFGRRRSNLPANEDNWTKQAEQVATNLRSFTTFLHSIRRAYLDLGSTSSSHHHSSQPRALDTSKGLAAWEGVRWLSDRERDEIDFGVKVALRRSVDRVRELEGAEKGQSPPASLLPTNAYRCPNSFSNSTARLANEARLNPNNKLSRFLGLPTSSSSPSGSSPSETLAAHRNHVTFYLNTLLANVSQHQRDQQEARVVRQLEKSATLGGFGGGAAMGMEQYGRGKADQARSNHLINGPSLAPTTTTKGKGKDLGGAQVGQVPSIYKPAPLPTSTSTSSSYQDPEDILLRPLLAPNATQIQQFEAEESALLKSTQTDLASIKLAESSLLEIAALQSQLAMHLSQQAEVTDKLWDEAVGVTGRVEEGNVQLKKARERNKESRLMLLFLLIMASGSLVFLDYYS